jgi:HSP20 family molecular chaperone IbpA
MDHQSLIAKYNDQVRRQYDQTEGAWYFSVVDVLGVATKSTDARNYWKVFKNRLKSSQNQLVTEFIQLKMESRDGKFYLTDAANGETMLKILELVSKDGVPSFKSYLASLGSPKGPNLSHLKTEDFEPKKIFAVKTSGIDTSYPQEENENVDFTLMIDLYRKNNSLVAEAFIAGVSLSDLSIVATQGSLTIEGSRKSYGTTDQENYDKQEISWGTFSRIVVLPYEIEIEKVSAVDNRGLVTIIMPMIDKSYSRRVKIKSI